MPRAASALSILTLPVLISALLLALLGGAACDRSSGTTTNDGGALACVPAPTVCPAPAPTWTDVSPIFQNICVQCHNGMIGGPWPLMQYQHVADWRDLVRAMVIDCSMPPPDAGVPMTDEERIAILTWILCGAPQ